MSAPAATTDPDDGCACDASAGDYVGTARRAWVSRDPRITFAKTGLGVRGD